MAAPDPKKQLEIEKLQAEIAKLSGETQNSAQAAEFAKQDRNWAYWPRWRDVVLMAVGLVPMGAVIIALWTLQANQEKDAIVQQREERKFVVDLSKTLADGNPAVRISAATSLAVYLKDEKFAEPVAAALIGALLVEKDTAVRGVLLQVIPSAGGTALRETRNILPIGRIKLGEHGAEVERLRQQLYQLRIDDHNSEQLPAAEANLRLALREAASLQHAIVGLVMATRPLVPSAECTKAPSCDACRVALTDFHLDGFDFASSGFALCNVDFHASSMVAANFSGLDVKQSDFIDTVLREAHFRDASLEGADFSDSHMDWQSDGIGERPSAYFTGADLSNAVFTRACLSGADFHGVKSRLEPAQFADAYANGAKFDAPVADALAKANALKEGPGCLKRP